MAGCDWSLLLHSRLWRLNFDEKARKGLLFACKCLRMNIAHSCENRYVGRITQDSQLVIKGWKQRTKDITDGKASWKSELGQARADRPGGPNRYIFRASGKGVQADSGSVHSFDPAP